MRLSPNYFIWRLSKITFWMLSSLTDSSELNSGTYHSPFTNWFVALPGAEPGFILKLLNRKFLCINSVFHFIEMRSFISRRIFFLSGCFSKYLNLFVLEMLNLKNWQIFRFLWNWYTSLSNFRSNYETYIFSIIVYQIGRTSHNVRRVILVYSQLALCFVTGRFWFRLFSAWPAQH